jgi:hypothetical protein
MVHLPYMQEKTKTRQHKAFKILIKESCNCNCQLLKEPITKTNRYLMGTFTSFIISTHECGA